MGRGIEGEGLPLPPTNSAKADRKLYRLEGREKGPNKRSHIGVPEPHKAKMRVRRSLTLPRFMERRAGIGTMNREDARKGDHDQEQDQDQEGGCSWKGARVALAGLRVSRGRFVLGLRATRFTPGYHIGGF
jgi:hypothetical protein